MRPLVLALTLLALLAACQPLRDTPPAPAVAAAADSSAWSDDAPPAGAIRYALDAARSQVRVLVYRGGRLARLGHNHVISTAELSGELWLAEPVTASRVTLRVPKNRLVVDDPALRAAAGADEFPPGLPDSARRGTAENMLSEALLHAAAWPEVSVQTTGVAVGPTADSYALTLAVQVLGTSREITLPVTVRVAGDTVHAAGEASVTHEALGLTPFSAMLGALRVQDEMRFEYDFVAVKDPGG